MPLAGTFRWRKRTAIRTFAVLAVCLVAWWIWIDRAAQADRDAAINALRGKGHPVWWGEVVEANAAAGSNPGVLQFRQAVQKLAACRVPTGATYSQVLNSRYRIGKNSQIRSELQAAAPRIAELDMAIRLEPPRISAELPGDPLAALKGDFHASRAFCHLAQLELADAMAEGDFRRAWRSVERPLEIARMLREELLIVGQLVRIAECNVAVDMIRALICVSAPDDAEFARIDAKLEEQHRTLRLANAMRAEGALWITALQNPMSLAEDESGWSAPNTLGESMRQSLRRFTRHVAATSLFAPMHLSAQAAVARFYDLQAELIDRPPPIPAADAARLEELTARLPRALLGTDSIYRRMYGPLQFASVASFHQRNALARLAIRISRNRARTGKLPARLEEVCDHALPSLPVKWLYGMPPTYLPGDESFVLELPAECIAGGPPTWREWARWEVQFDAPHTVGPSDVKESR